MYYVYILRCAGGTLYTGITTDPARRFREHCGQGGRGAKYTHARPPLRIEAVWSAPDRREAARLESRIKMLSRPEKEDLICGRADCPLPGFCRVNAGAADAFQPEPAADAPGKETL